MIAGPPLKINSIATPTTYHSPLPFPIHWQNDVNKGLDRMCLGVVESVPISEKATWCHRMVICMKKKGKPRRKIDIQPFNKHATRETHHIQFPFYQAKSVPHGKKKWCSMLKMAIMVNSYIQEMPITPPSSYWVMDSPDDDKIVLCFSIR